MYNCSKKIKSYYYIFTFLHCFIVSCAQVTAPTGGERDKTPPTITHSNPPNSSINFHQNEIKIAFDEWIQPLTNPKSQVIISPEIEPFPSINIARNDLSIKFKDSLFPNTTYSIFFGDNIKDNNEGNIFTNFKYIFSTGAFIDSLSVKGTINTSLSKFPDNTYLLLYKDKDDSAFLTKRPFYITKIQNDGSFKLENVKEGNYRIYALSDKNSNYYYDLPTEEIAFSDSFWNISSNIDSINLELFLPEDSILRIQEFDRTIHNGILQLTFNKELSLNKDEITTEVVELPDYTPIAFTEKDAKKMSIYFPKLLNDTNSLSIVIKNNGKLIDTLNIKTTSKNATKPILFFNDTIALKNITVIETQPLKFVSTYYSLATIDTAKILLKDTAGNIIPFTIQRNEDLQTYLINANWKDTTQYKLLFQDSVLSDLAGNYNKTQEFLILARSTKKAGKLLITYQLPQRNMNYIVILKDNTDKVLDRRILSDSQRVQVNYGLILAGSYLVEVIDDVNKNGIWNSGNFSTKTLPEKIYKEQKPILIKENWDADETINVDFSKSVSRKTTTPKNENTEPPAINNNATNNFPTNNNKTNKQNIFNNTKD